MVGLVADLSAVEPAARDAVGAAIERVRGEDNGSRRLGDFEEPVAALEVLEPVTRELGLDGLAGAALLDGGGERLEPGVDLGIERLEQGAARPVKGEGPDAEDDGRLDEEEEDDEAETEGIHSRAQAGMR